MRFILALLLALCTAFPARAEPVDIAAASRSVVRVVLIGNEGGEPTLVGHGSGFAVAPDVIMTNAHVVEPARDGGGIRIGIVPSQGKGGWFGRVIAVAPTADLALIRLTERGSLPPATLFTGAVADGSDVVAVGYPGNVDLAQGLNVGDIVSPTSPVKTRGTVSAGRSSKNFETILHTAPVGGGNSGGPLLDTCGRVIGVNSFGTIADQGDSEFYFAVSTHEMLRFLRASNITPQITGIGCRSLADLQRDEAERQAGQKVRSEEQARALEAKQRAALEQAEREALFAVIASRENRLALALVALMLALAAGGGGYLLREQGRQREARLATAAAGLLVLGALAAWLLRPGFAEVASRAAEAVKGAGKDARAEVAGKAADGTFLCTLDMARSRVTVSEPADLELAWGSGGCANGKQQFGLGADGWRLVTAPDAQDSVAVASFDPASGSYRAERYFLDFDTAAKLREEYRKLRAPACGGGEERARQLREAQSALTAMLPESPNERLVYDCRAGRPAR